MANISFMYTVKKYLYTMLVLLRSNEGKNMIKIIIFKQLWPSLHIVARDAAQSFSGQVVGLPDILLALRPAFSHDTAYRPVKDVFPYDRKYIFYTELCVTLKVVMQRSKNTWVLYLSAIFFGICFLKVKKIFSTFT